MGPQAHRTTDLPKRILQELGSSGYSRNGAQKSRQGLTRKEQRKAARVGKTTQELQAPATTPGENGKGLGSASPVIGGRSSSAKVRKSQHKSPRSEAKRDVAVNSGVDRSRSSSPEDSANYSVQIKSQLARDDAEIEALEKALGVKDRKTLPKSFEEDGLDSLLDGLDDVGSLAPTGLGKRKRRDEDQWLAKKRQKAQEFHQELDSPDDGESSVFEGFDVEDSVSDDMVDVHDFSENSQRTEDDSSLDRPDGQTSLPARGVERSRENPYVAPLTRSSQETATKYVPPSLRARHEEMTEDLSQLRRQLQGLLNRLSEAKLLPIVEEVEKLFQNHPRHNVTTVLIEILIGLLSDRTALQDTFIILHAGFIAALYKILGSDFGAHMVSKIDEEFNHHYQRVTLPDVDSKNATNLIALVAQLYTLQVIGSNIVYDYIRMCLRKLSETNTELLLKILRTAGHQLRQDDPSALRDIAIQLQKAVERAGEKGLSVRTKFMVETISSIKDNRVKTGLCATSISSEHTLAMKKMLGTLNQRSLRATEPLGIGLRDVRDVEKRGKWWLVGASYKDDEQDKVDLTLNNADPLSAPSFQDSLTTESGDLVHLAKEQRMNTEVRRSIFVAMMSATDYNDAYVRFMKLRLKKNQELEIPKVIVHCAGAEKVYNPYYTLLSRRVCSDRKLKMAFQFSLWDIFKTLGETNLDDEEQVSDTDNTPDFRSIVNLARMYGSLIADGGLSLAILKNLNLAFLQPRTRTFVELLLTTVIIESQKSYGDHRNEANLLEIFLRPKEMAEMASSLRYFLKKVVSKSDIAGSRQDRDTVKWGCKMASDALAALTNGASITV